jgi:hypothetical protein
LRSGGFPFIAGALLLDAPGDFAVPHAELNEHQCLTWCVAHHTSRRRAVVVAARRDGVLLAVVAIADWAATPSRGKFSDDARGYASPFTHVCCSCNVRLTEKQDSISASSWRPHDHPAPHTLSQNHPSRSPKHSSYGSHVSPTALPRRAHCVACIHTRRR